MPAICAKMIDLGLDILSQVVYHAASAGPDHARIALIAKVCRVFSATCLHSALWQQLIVSTWRRQLAWHGPDWRKSYMEVDQRTKLRLKGWNACFFHHEPEVILWQGEMRSFLDGLGSVENARDFLCTYPLHKQLRGEYLGAAASEELRMSCVKRLMHLSGTDVVGALQQLFAKMSARTSMALDRLVLALSAHYHSSNMQHLCSPNVVHTIMYAALMLNTDMYSKNVPYSDKMTRGSFVQSVLRMREGEHAFVPIPVIERIFNRLESDGPFRIDDNDDFPTDYSIPKLVCAHLPVSGVSKDICVIC